MSGLAQIMKNMGFKVQGSDLSKNKNTTSCSNLGIKVFIGHSVKNLKNSTIWLDPRLLKIAILRLNMQLERKFQSTREQKLLADIVSLKKNIIITGFMVKQQPPRLLSKILSDQKLDPTIINGGVINSFQ